MFNVSQILRSFSFATKTSPYAFLSSSSLSSVASAPSLTKHHLSTSMPPIKQFVDNTIAENKIVVFSKSYCPFCSATKSYFADKYPKESVKVIELDTRDDESAIQDYLKKKTGARSVPRTFINGVSVGGNDDLHGKPKKVVDALIAGRNTEGKLWRNNYTP